MNFRTLAAAATLSLLAASPALAKDYKVGQIEIEDLWVRATVPGQPNGAGYMKIENDGKQADRLLAVQSPAAERIELHATGNENGVARMRRVDGVEIAADGKATLAPGGHHIMFLKLKEPFKAGTQIPATLTFEHAGQVDVSFEVKPAAYNPEGEGSMNHETMDHGSMGHGSKPHGSM